MALAFCALAIAGRRTINLEEPKLAADDAGRAALPDITGTDDLQDLAFDRPDYKYSVIPGGAYDRLELQSAIQDDPVVAAHYRQLDQSRVRTETVTHDRYVHVSYRKDNRIFWTKKKVLLRQGETILTDGKTQIRARCGNCISDRPLLPTSDREPDVVEFDGLTDPASQWQTSAADWEVPPATIPGAAASPAAAASPGEPATPLAAGRIGSGTVPLVGANAASGSSGPETHPEDNSGTSEPAGDGSGSAAIGAGLAADPGRTRAVLPSRRTVPGIVANT